MKAISSTLLEHIHTATVSETGCYQDLKNVSIEIPPNPLHGDITTNAAMVLANSMKTPPRDLAQKICQYLEHIEDVETVEVAGPGFINIRLKKAYWQQSLKSILADGKSFGQSNIGDGKRINLEFVSANPTGPVHIGHARGAVYGDVLANLLIKCGYYVTREYYVNDAGNQIKILAASLFVRYQNLFGQNEAIPEGGYPGEYLIDVAEALKTQHGNALLDMEEEQKFAILSDFAVAQMLKLIQQDLAALGVMHDIFVHEKSDVIQTNKTEQAIATLAEKNLIYRGILEAPKSAVAEDWEAKEQLIFKATDFGDDSDRPMARSDGSYTYFAADAAYHLHKIERGFNDMILVLGADHTGYTKRIRAVVKALSDNKADVNVIVTQLVNLSKNGQAFKMSKRAGNFITLKEMLDEVGKDALRFSMLLKKNDTVIDLDCEKAKEQSKDNPIFYVQYAHARAHSIFRKAAQDDITLISFENINYARLQDDHDIALIKQLAIFPKMLESASTHQEPHKITYYLQELANLFHQIWTKGMADTKARFLYPHDLELTHAKLALVKAVATTIAIGLEIVGITPMDKM